jgi:hypothetical protein
MLGPVVFGSVAVHNYVSFDNLLTFFVGFPVKNLTGKVYRKVPPV